MTIQDLFELGMKRRLPGLLEMPEGLILNVGAGNHEIRGTEPIDIEHGWDADHYDLPFPEESVAGIHCYHFLEHVADPIGVLADFQRVLIRGGVVNIGVPHCSGEMAFQDLDHKNFFTTETWQKLFANPYYDKYKIRWQFRVHINFVMYIVERNAMLFTQLEKI